jgi:hypothetical protein
MLDDVSLWECELNTTTNELNTTTNELTEAILVSVITVARSLHQDKALLLSTAGEVSSLWSNCTVVGFSKKFLILGDIASTSSGIHWPAILGNEL